MKCDPILEEVWRVKDELAREAGYDIHQLCENTRRWAAEHPFQGLRLVNDEELRRYLASGAAQTPVSPLALNDKPAP